MQLNTKAISFLFSVIFLLLGTSALAQDHRVVLDNQRTGELVILEVGSYVWIKKKNGEKHKGLITEIKQDTIITETGSIPISSIEKMYSYELGAELGGFLKLLVGPPLAIYGAAAVVAGIFFLEGLVVIAGAGLGAIGSLAFVNGVQSIFRGKYHNLKKWNLSTVQVTNEKRQ